MTSLDTINPFVREWLDEMKSGKHHQQFGVLRHPYYPQFCPLGLACELHDPTQWDGMMYQGEGHHLPEEVRVRLGLRTPEGDFALTSEVQCALPPDVVDKVLRTSVANHRLTIAGLNDAEMDFNEIATVIECRPPGLFIPD